MYTYVCTYICIVLYIITYSNFSIAHFHDLLMTIMMYYVPNKLPHIIIFTLA